MRNHLVHDCNCKIVNLYPPKKLQRVISDVGFTLSVGDTTLTTVVFLMMSTLHNEEDN